MPIPINKNPAPIITIAVPVANWRSETKFLTSETLVAVKHGSIFSRSTSNMLDFVCCTREDGLFRFRHGLHAMLHARFVTFVGDVDERVAEFQ